MGNAVASTSSYVPILKTMLMKRQRPEGSRGDRSSYFDEGSVNTSTTAKVQYTYASGSSNTIRATGLVYPSGRVLTYSYGSTGGQSDRLSRVESYIDDDGTSHIIDYTFLGAGTFVESDRPQPSLKWSIITDQGGTDPNTGDIYRGLDRFGRVTDNQWFGNGTGSNVDVDRIRYGYDRAGNRMWRENPVATSFSKEFDEIYSYDALHRLKDMARGRLNTAKTALTSTTFAQCWTLDSTGNWSGFREDDTGDGTWDLVQARTANDVNEIAGITNSVGAAWVQPAYSPAGNMTTMPQPNDPTKGYTATYDAWNRLVKFVDTPTSNTVSEYAYDGAKRQIRQKNYESGTLTETRHLYYTHPASWRCLEERLGTTPDTTPPDRQFVWGRRYIDDLILRDRAVTSSSSSSGSGPNPLGERFFARQDGNWNVTLIMAADSILQWRFIFSAYGASTTLSPEHDQPAQEAKTFEYLFAGYRQGVIYCVRSRTYHFALGAWSSRDPAFSTGNLYEYSAAPLSQTDPLGLDPIESDGLTIEGVETEDNSITRNDGKNPSLGQASARLKDISCTCRLIKSPQRGFTWCPIYKYSCTATLQTTISINMTHLKVEFDGGDFWYYSRALQRIVYQTDPDFSLTMEQARQGLLGHERQHVAAYKKAAQAAIAAANGSSGSYRTSSACETAATAAEFALNADWEKGYALGRGHNTFTKLEDRMFLD
jgi:RHS repeat-associated protein